MPECGDKMAKPMPMRYLPVLLILAALAACSQGDEPDVDATATAAVAASQATAEAAQAREDIVATITAAAPTPRPSPTATGTPTPKPPPTATATATSTPTPTPTATPTPRPLRVGPFPTPTPPPPPLVIADPSMPHTIKLAELLNERNRLLYEIPDFAGQPSSEEVNVWSRALRDWVEAQEGYCGNVSNFELERANCNQMAVDALEMQQALSGWQRRP